LSTVCPYFYQTSVIAGTSGGAVLLLLIILISSINISTNLQSDVLLLCNFNSSLLGSDLTADIAAVWSYRNITEDNLLEISLQGVVLFWNNRDGRINPFPKLSTSGNFSILLHKVNKSDLGLYRCELFSGTNCSIAYQEIYL
uniref:Ig-like domain-containing protein n=1 Tax=Astyanax mexicanus TaxID=7994 RepID=A0A3B1JHK8_ASTMX